MVCFHATLGIGGVDMEGIQMSTYLLDGVEALIGDHQDVSVWDLWGA